MHGTNAGPNIVLGWTWAVHSHKCINMSMLFQQQSSNYSLCKSNKTLACGLIFLSASSTLYSFVCGFQQLTSATKDMGSIFFKRVALYSHLALFFFPLAVRNPFLVLVPPVKNRWCTPFWVFFSTLHPKMCVLYTWFSTDTMQFLLL